MGTSRLWLVVAACTGIVLPLHAQSWTDVSPAVRPSARFGARMAYDAARQKVLLFGGNTTNQYVTQGDTWLWDGAGWTQAIPTPAPPARFGHAMAYDEARGEVVLFGGMQVNGTSNDTWIWNGSTWTRKSPANSPSNRYYHAMAYDPMRKQVILLGGNPPAADSETWAWDGTNWTRLTPPVSPTARAAHAMAWDPVRQVILLYGGQGIGGGNIGDTWSWNGTTWKNEVPLSATFPGSFRSPAMVTHGNRVLLITGSTYSWTGTGWQLLMTDSVLPEQLVDSAVAWHAARNHTLLFGGSNVALGLFGSSWSFAVENECALPEGASAAASISSTGGAVEWSVPGTAGCTWKATTASAWITIQSPNGTVPAPLRVSAAANPGPLARTASIRVGGGRYYEIVQAAPPCPTGGALTPGPLYLPNGCSVSYTYTASAGDQIMLRAIGRGPGPTLEWIKTSSTTLSIARAESPAVPLATAMRTSAENPITLLPAAGVFSFPSAGNYLISITTQGGSDGYAVIDWMKSGQGCATNLVHYSEYGMTEPTGEVPVPSGGGLFGTFSAGVAPGCNGTFTYGGTGWLSTNASFLTPG